MDNSRWNLIGEEDRILSVGAVLPEGILGKHFSAVSLENAEGTYNLIVGENLLNKTYKIQEYFRHVQERLENRGLHMLTEPIVAGEDGWINTLVATVSADHVRFPRAEELISIAAEKLELTEFLRFTVQRVYPVSECSAEPAEKQIKEMPDKYRDLLRPALFDGRLEIRQLMGFFIWQK
jgi:hypothetical protein